MLFKSRENQCMLQVLQILDKKPRTYGFLFKETKKSHTTLQGVLKYLIGKEFVVKGDEGYNVTDKGKRLLQKLLELWHLL